MFVKLNYRCTLDSADRAAILSLSHIVKSLEAGNYIVREFDRPEASTLLLDGFAMRQKIVAGGKRQILSVHMKGEVVDLQNSFLGVTDHSVQMLTSGKVAVIPREEIKRIAFARPAVGQAMWTDTLVDASVFREWIANVGQRDARTRIAHVLCEFALRLKVAGLGEQSSYTMPITQEQLADATGMTPVHVNRSLKLLESQGLIERSNPRSIVIGDWKELADSADFNSNYLHFREGEPALRGERSHA